MREIKFRAWDHEDKKMWKVVGITEPIWGDCEEAHIRVCEFHENPSKKETDVRMSVDYELMQCSGLIDIKGNEIFEKDLIKDDENFIWEVFYKQGAFYAKCTDLMAEQLLSSINLFGVVIGNIYENPELLEGANH